MEVNDYANKIDGQDAKNDIVCKNDDPCFSLEYARLYEDKENGKAELFFFENEKGRVEHVFIKRRITDTVNGKQYYDITSPYGYGGPVIVKGEQSIKLLEDYFDAFHNYCLEQNIISEFVRFHLHESNLIRTYYYGETAVIGPHVIRDLKLALRKDMDREIQRSLNKAEKAGLTIHYDTTGERIKEFIKIYDETMKRNNASDYYHFEPSFFDDLHSNLKNKFIYVSAELDGKTISSRLSIFGEKYGFGFLGGTLKEYFYTQATTAVDYYLLKYLKDKNCCYFSFGGGFKSNDGIYKYKKNFSKGEDIPFYIGKKIHHPHIYDQLVIIHKKTKEFDNDSHFFPLYRI